MQSIKLVVLFYFLANYSYSQNTASDSLESKIREQILFQIQYNSHEGIPTQWINGMEVHGYYTMQRTIYFNDSIFQEFVFEDNNLWITLDSSKNNEYILFSNSNTLLVYSGTWRIKTDTIELQMKSAILYNDTDSFHENYYNFYFLKPHSVFQSKESIFKEIPILENKSFLFKENDLHEIGGHYLYQ